MTKLLILTFALLAAGVCFSNWRRGLFVCILIGFLQDTIRKIVPGEPAYFVIIVGLFVVATVAGAKMLRVPLKMGPVHKWYGVLRKPLLLFSVLVIFQSGMTLIRFGSPVLAGIGLMSYLSIVPALLLAYYFGRTLRETEKLFRFYAYCAVVASAGIYLSFFGIDWTILKSVGEELFITVYEKSLYAHPGFMRSSEIAAWHAATASCFLIIFASMPDSKKKLLQVLLVVGLIIAIILTGRRKMLMEVILFGTFYAFLLFRARRGVTRLAALLLIIGILLSISVTLYSVEPGEQSTDYVVRQEFNPYAQRGITTFAESTERFNKLGISSVYWAIQKTGLWGIGAGVGSQGSQHFGGGFATAGGAIEGGLGRIVAELGVPGLLLAAWLGVGMFRYIRRILALMKDADPKITYLTFGLVAFLAANVPVYIVAAPAYGDLFVILILGWTLGFVFAIPRILALSKTALSPKHSPLRGRNRILPGVR